MLFFGYTNCPDLCPTTLATLAAMEKRLRAAKAPVRPQVVFVSVDAKRDTPAQMAKYVPYFDPEFIGLTAADQPSIEAVAKKLGVSVVIEPAADGRYAVDHSGDIFVLDPDGRLAAILSGPFGVEALQGDFQRIVAARGPVGGHA
jgi:protein SCO1/2